MKHSAPYRKDQTTKSSSSEETRLDEVHQEVNILQASHQLCSWDSSLPRATQRPAAGQFNLTDAGTNRIYCLYRLGVGSPLRWDVGEWSSREVTGGWSPAQCVGVSSSCQLLQGVTPAGLGEKGRTNRRASSCSWVTTHLPLLLWCNDSEVWCEAAN